MADRYYSDQPSFRRKDPLVTWSYVFLGIAALATVWILVLMFLWSRNIVGTENELWGITEGRWVVISVGLLVAAILGLIFVIVARLGGATGGGYLSTELEGPPRTRTLSPPPAKQDAEPVTRSAATAHAPESMLLRPPARIDDPFGPDGRMLVSYTVPEQQPRGIYADTWVLIDADALLNVRTLLAKTSGAPRGGMSMGG